MGKLFFFFSIFMILPICYIIFNILDKLEILKEVDVLNNDCKILRGAVGIEDLVKFNQYLIGGSDEIGKLLILKEFGNKNTPNGNMIKIDTTSGYDNSEIKILKMNNYPTDIAFHPHGIYLYKEKYLYVINHAYHKGGERVEVFEIVLKDNSDIELNYLKSIRFDDKYMGSFNDLIVIGEDEIFITQYRIFPDDGEEGRSHNKIDKMLDMSIIALNLKLTHIFYCKGTFCQKVPGTSSNLNNGITYDFNNTIYAVNTLERRIRVFKINRKNEKFDKLIFEKDIDIGFAIHNVVYEKETDLIYAGTVGRIKEVLGVIDFYTNHKSLDGLNSMIAGSLVINPQTDQIKVTVMKHHKFYAISVVCKVNNLFYHGSFIDNGVLICKEH